MSAASSARRWGETYSGNCSIEDACAGILEFAEGIGLSCSVTRTESDTVVRGIQQRSLLHILSRSLPQEVVWVLATRGSVVEISADFRIFRWYGWVMVAAVLACPILLFGGLLIIVSRSGPHAVGGIGIVLGLYCIWQIAAWLEANGGRHAAKAWETVRRRVEDRGGYLDPVRGAINRRYRAKIYLLLAGAGLLLVPLLSDMSFSTTVWAAIPMVSFLGFGLFTAVGLMVACHKYPGLTLRLAPAVPGLTSALAFVLFTYAPFTYIVATVPAENAASLLDAAGIDVRSIPANVVQTKLHTSASARRNLGVASMTGAGLITAVGFFLLVSASRSAARMWPDLVRLTTEPGHVSRREATGAKGFLSFFQLCLGLLWAATVVSVAAAAAWSVVMVATCVGVHFEIAERLIRVTSVCLRWALSIRQHDAETAARVAYLLHSIVILATLGISTGELTRRTSRRRRASPPIVPSESVAATVAEVIRTGRFKKPITIVVVASRVPFGAARRTLVGRTVYLSTATTELLAADELRGLIAHEISHHALGHCVIDAILVVLGRLTFVGDTFVRVIQDSFGNEIAADRLAVRRFDVDARLLRKCILRMHHVAAATGHASLEGAPFLPPPDASHSIVTNAQAFTRQYFQSSHLGYWHPSIDERLAQLR